MPQKNNNLNDFNSSEFWGTWKGVVQDVANLTSDIKQPHKFATIFCEAAESQKNIEKAIKAIIVQVIDKDIDAQRSIENIVENVDRKYIRVITGKIGIAGWSIIVAIVSAATQAFLSK